MHLWCKESEAKITPIPLYPYAPSYPKGVRVAEGEGVILSSISEGEGVILSSISEGEGVRQSIGKLTLNRR